MPWEDWIEFRDWLDHWQVLIAGALGAAAALYVVRITLRSEGRREARDAVALRRAVLAEMWGYADQALNGHQTLRELLRPGDHTITLHEMEEAVRFPDPVIYPGAAARLGLLGEQTHFVVNFYQQFQALRDTMGRIRINEGRVLNPDDLIEALLSLAETGARLLPRLRVSREDSQADVNFAAGVERERRSWDDLRRQRGTMPG
jgi:hypothetical protein